MAETATTSASEKPPVTLHWLDGSRAQSILWLLEELHIPYELDIHHRKKSLQAPSALKQIHPLGKSPLVTIRPPGDASAQPIVLAESGFIVQYLSGHWSKEGSSLLPQRWKEGQEGKFGGETKEWMRCQYLLHYVEGSFMPYISTWLVFTILKGPSVPFLLRPITGMIANQVTSKYIFPSITSHFSMLESFLSDDVGGQYLCGAHLSAGDILLLFPLLSLQDAGALPTLGPWEKGTPEETYPKLFEYISRMVAEPGYVRAVNKIRDVEGEYHVAPKLS